jgi:hypothetical protein
MLVYIMPLCLWMHICIYVVVRFELYICIYVYMLWSDLNYIFEFNFFCWKMYCRGGSRLNGPYKLFFRGGPTNQFVEVAGPLQINL